MQIGPIHYTILSEQNLVHVQVAGHLQAQHILAYLGVLGQDEDYAVGMDVLVDLCHVDHYDIDTDAMHIVAEANEGFDQQHQPSKCALVSPSDSVYGMLRMFQALTEGQNIEVAVFREVAEAAQWLNATLE